MHLPSHGIREAVNKLPIPVLQDNSGHNPAPTTHGAWGRGGRWNQCEQLSPSCFQAGAGAD